MQSGPGFITGVIVTPINWVGNIEIHTDCSLFKSVYFCFWNQRRDGRWFQILDVVFSIDVAEKIC